MRARTRSILRDASLRDAPQDEVDGWICRRDMSRRSEAEPRQVYGRRTKTSHPTYERGCRAAPAESITWFSQQIGWFDRPADGPSSVTIELSPHDAIVVGGPNVLSSWGFDLV